MKEKEKQREKQKKQRKKRQKRKTRKDICAKDATFTVADLSVLCAAADIAKGNKTAVPPPISAKPNKARYGPIEKQTKISPMNMEIIDTRETFTGP